MKKCCGKCSKMKRTKTKKKAIKKTTKKTTKRYGY